MLKCVVNKFIFNHFISSSNVKKKKTKPSINKSRTNSRPKGKSSKLLSVESNQIKAATVSSEPNNISCQKKRGNLF